jgi:beta-galactosidase
MHTDKLYYGAAYYDEYMPLDRVEKDMEMMEKAGMNVIRIAESTWSTWEPIEGQFDFTHLHRMLDAAKRHHISVIVGTPTYAIPSWLANKADDILAVTHDGPQIYGHRQNMDITNPIYRKHAEILIRKLMEEVKDEPHVIGFQLDNETKSYDTCGPRAQQMFVDSLKEQYPDIQEFNREFGLDYWSNRIDRWEDFPDIRGTINQSLASEYARFQRKLVTDFLAWQAAIVKEYRRPDQFITQNFDYEWHDYSFGVQPEVNQFEAAKSLTVSGCDIYHPSQDELTGCEITVCGNIARSLKRSNYLVLETEAQGNQAWLPYPGQLRLQAYSHIANGSNMVEYWHWHSIHNAIESYWKGVLSHDLVENETYRDCCVIGQEWKRIGSSLKNLKKVNRVALLADNDSLTALSLFPTETNGKSSYNCILRSLADALFHLNIEYDIIPADASLLDEYDCILIPALYSAKESFLVALDRYVADGGNLVMTFKSAFSDEHMKIYHDTQPHVLSKTFGIAYDRFTYPKNVTVSYQDVTSDASEWMELVTCCGARSLADYHHPAWGRYSAVAENSYGKGHTLYLATLLNDAIVQRLLSDFFQEIGLQESEKLPHNAQYPVSVKQGKNDAGEHIMYYLNYSADIHMAENIAGDGIELITGAPVAKGESFRLEPWGVAVLQIPQF